MKCRHCNQLLVLPFLDLRSAPPSNAYLTSTSLDQPEVWYPLKIMVCHQCWLVQTIDYNGCEELFNPDYAYFSSYSTTWLEHAQNYVQKMESFLSLDTNSLVVEVAANDGYLLQYVKEKAIPCYGIEPTQSTAKAAKSKGIEIFEEFFGENFAKSLVLQGNQADLIIANNVLAHVPDINDFVTGFSILLKPQGVATFEFPHLLRMVQGCQFDTAYHEHYSYLSLTAVQRIFLANGLTVFKVEELSTHGGSLRVFAQRNETGKYTIDSSVDQLLNLEKQVGLLQENFYLGFQGKVAKIKYELLSFLLECKSKNIKVVAYGAAAKGNTLLNFSGIHTDLIAYVVDKNPEKQGKYLPGSHIPIVSENNLIEDCPDLVLILPWNLREEIINQLAYIRGWGGKFLTAVPKLATW